MAATRAEAVAEVLWELKRAGKVATCTAIARRAGFSPGANGRAINSCLDTVRRDWPHLEWWRAVSDDGTIKDSTEQVNQLRGLGVEFQNEGEPARVSLPMSESLVMIWEGAQPPAAVHSV